MSKKIVFLDLDGVLADFDAAAVDQNGSKDLSKMFVKGFFRSLPIKEGAKEAVDRLRQYQGIQLCIGSKPVKTNLWSTIEKYEWVQEHFPFLLPNVTLTFNKGLLLGDFLVDDDSIWKELFRGEFILFDRERPHESWDVVLNRLREWR